MSKEHAINCESRSGRGCDCGLTGMAGVDGYAEDGTAVYKQTATLRATSPMMTAAEARESIRKTGAATEWLKRRRSSEWGDAISIRAMSAEKLLKILKNA